MARSTVSHRPKAIDSVSNRCASVASRKFNRRKSIAAKHIHGACPRTHYDKNTYYRAIQLACDAAFPPPDGLTKDELKRWRKQHRWHPNQLRHAVATKVRRDFGLEGAQVILGHANAAVSQVYAERDLQKASWIISQLG